LALHAALSVIAEETSQWMNIYFCNIQRYFMAIQIIFVSMEEFGVFIFL